MQEFVHQRQNYNNHPI